MKLTVQRATNFQVWKDNLGSFVDTRDVEIEAFYNLDILKYQVLQGLGELFSMNFMLRWRTRKQKKIVLVFLAT